MALTLRGKPPSWAASLRSPYLLGIFFGTGFIAYTLSLMLMMGIPPLPLVRGLNDLGFALVVLALTLLGMAVWTRSFRASFLAVGFGVGLAGLLAGFELTHLVFFAFWHGNET